MPRHVRSKQALVECKLSTDVGKTLLQAAVTENLLCVFAGKAFSNTLTTHLVDWHGVKASCCGIDAATAGLIASA